jgi:hypothetical protein
MRLRIFLSVLVAIVSCKPVDKKVEHEQSIEREAKSLASDSASLDPEPIVLEFKRRYSVFLPEEYVGWPDPGEDNNYPSIFSISDDSLSIHTPIYELKAPNYFTYQIEDSLAFGSARMAREIDDYWYHLRVDEYLLSTNISSDRQFKNGEAYFFKFPSNRNSFYYWVLFNLRDEGIELYKLDIVDSTSNLIKRFDCFNRNLNEMSIISECRFRTIYNSVLYYNTINNGFFYIDLDKGTAKCGVFPKFADYLVGVTGGDSLVVSNSKKDTAWILDQDGKKIKTFKWSLDNSVYDELLLDPNERKMLLSKYDWETFRFDIYEAKF